MTEPSGKPAPASSPAWEGILTPSQVDAFAPLALRGIGREYPHKPGIVLAGPETPRLPRGVHPVFYGCFDWHSAVHGHWMLVRLLKRYPRASCVAAMRDLLRAHLTQEGLAGEVGVFQPAANRSFERMYGWAWALRLAVELRTWDDDDAQRWAAFLSPLEQRLVALIQDYLPRLRRPVRTGIHPDTSFALAQALDYARGTGQQCWADELCRFARRYYQDDRDYNARWEPSGEDFFSPVLNEADLMRRVLATDEFATWLERLLPGWMQPDSAAASLLTPVEVSDVTDGRLVHWAGLNLSRGWCFQGLAAALPPDDPRTPALQAAEQAHAAAGLRYVESGHYEGEHWLATFAVYLLDQVGIA